MSKKQISQQSERLSLFVAKTGYSISEFSRQCNIASPRTMTKIVTDGIAPTSKVLEKIIARFPQLNHDWVILGYGEMIIPGMTNQASGNSVLKSKGASYQQISDKQIETSFGINELARKVEQAMALNAQTTQILTNKVEQMQVAIKDAETSLLEERSKRSILFQKTKEEHIELIKDLNEKREEKMASEFFKLSDKVHNHLSESRKLQVNLFKKAEQNYTLEMNNKLSEGIILINKAMKKNAVDQTEYAINVFLDKINPKKLFKKIGNHSLNKKP